MAWSIRFREGFLFCLFPLPILLPSFLFIWNSHASFFNFPRFFVFFSLPLFYPAVNLSKLIEHSPNTTVNSLPRGLLRRQQAADLYFLLHSMGMQQIWPAVPWRVLALLNHFAQWCSGLASNFFSLKLLYAVCWRALLAGECCIPLPPSPAPTHLLYGLSQLWKRNILSIAFCCFWPVHISVSKYKVLCVPFPGWWLFHNVASPKTPILYFQLGWVTHHSPWSLLPH